ncbi:MAG: coagulation factor 5/8 type domain-containing protein [Phycisphaerales bacterium]
MTSSLSKSIVSFLLVAVFGWALCACQTATKPLEGPTVSSPDFGPNVFVFDPSMPDVQQHVDQVFKRQEKSQFGSDRYALLFKPGKYPLDMQVGFYTHVAGLGRSPDEVEIEGAVRAHANWMKGNATCNFWRSVENLSIAPTSIDIPNMWGVSQGASMRRVHVKGDLLLADHGWSSGGFLSDCKIDGEVNSGSQQQWFSRNCDWDKWVGGNWNMVFVGCEKPPEGEWPERPYTVIERTPVAREKPFLFIDEAGRYFVMVPELRRETSGVTWASGPGGGTPISLEHFFIARPERDSVADINAALANGKHLLLTPGIYHLDSPIRVPHPGTVVFGLGYPTLVAESGMPAMTIADVSGVTIAGVLLDAGEIPSPTLLQVGESEKSLFHAADPTMLFDVFCRAGGATAGSTKSFVNIRSNNVIGDNLWLWRADHGKGTKWLVNRNENGLIVDGDDVVMYGLFVEHCHEYQTVWNGEGGKVYFYQSEMPYDPPRQEAWMHDGVQGFASYKVADHVKTHEAWGLGVYCVFWAAPIVAETAIEAPEHPGISMNHMTTIRLNGKADSGICHVINGRGEAVMYQQKAVVK